MSEVVAGLLLIVPALLVLALLKMSAMEQEDAKKWADEYARRKRENEAKRDEVRSKYAEDSKE